MNRPRRGYLLLEGMLAIALIGIGLGPLLSAMQSSQKGLLDAKLQAQANIYCESLCEHLRYQWVQDPTHAFDWASATVSVDPEGNFVGSYTIATFSAFPSPPPNNIATLFRLDAEVVWLPTWASLTPAITNYEAFRDELTPGARLTTFLGDRGP